jgi:hypothetical protein
MEMIPQIAQALEIPSLALLTLTADNVSPDVIEVLSTHIEIQELVLIVKGLDQTKLQELIAIAQVMKSNASNPTED